jgi:hypothetical protein
MPRSQDLRNPMAMTTEWYKSSFTWVYISFKKKKNIIPTIWVGGTTLRKERGVITENK